MIPGLPPFNNADLIIPRLWLGNKNASQDETFLKNADITVVFNCTKDLPFHSSIRRRYRVPVDDNLQEDEIRNLELWAFETVLKMLQEYKAGRSILVHCHAGMQRSPAVIAMFLIVYQRITAEKAMNFIKQRRPVAFFWNANFGPAIHGFDASFQKLMIEDLSR